VVLWSQAYISNGFRDNERCMQRNEWHDLDSTSKQRSRSFILVPINFSYTTSYRLSIVTFALGRTVYPQYICHRQTTDDDRQTQHCSISAIVSRVIKMVIIVSQQSTFRRYSAKVLSTFFIFGVFDVSLAIASLTSVITTFLHLGLLLNNNKHKH